MGSLLLLLGGLLLLSACSGLAYSGLTLWGGLKILAGRRSIERQLADPATPPELAERLTLALEMRDFASAELGLPDNGSYRSYVELKRPYAVWNVVAAPELSVEPLTWCFPVAGCVSYRGYFSPDRAERFAAKLRDQGHDVDVGGVAAYSTLGWVADPVLSTFIEWPEPDLAGLLFHELAHQRIYLKGDTTFNESFATVVGWEGVARWLRERRPPEELAAHLAAVERGEAFTDLMLAYRERLAAAYAEERADDWKRRRKGELFAALETDYQALRAGWDGETRYDGWMGAGLNNARLAGLGAYHQMVPAFRALLSRADADLEAFYSEVERLAELPAEERQTALERAMRDPSRASEDLPASGKLPSDS